MGETVDNSAKLTIKEIKIIDYICDKCNAGKVKPTGIMLTSMPPKYEHSCPYCGTMINLEHNYPRTVLVVK